MREERGGEEKRREERGRGGEERKVGEREREEREILKGYPSDDTENAVQNNIVSAGYA